MKNDPKRPRFQYLSWNCPKTSSCFLRLHKKLQIYWNIVYSIWKPTNIAFKCHRLNVNNFVTFCLILKTVPPYNLPYTRMAKWQAVYGIPFFKVAQNVTKVKISSLWHLKDKIPEFMMLEICCWHLCNFLYNLKYCNGV